MSAMVGYTLPCTPSVPTVHSDSVTLDSVPTPIRASFCVANSLRIHTPSTTFHSENLSVSVFRHLVNCVEVIFPIAIPIPSCCQGLKGSALRGKYRHEPSTTLSISAFRLTPPVSVFRFTLHSVVFSVPCIVFRLLIVSVPFCCFSVFLTFRSL